MENRLRRDRDSRRAPGVSNSQPRPSTMISPGGCRVQRWRKATTNPVRGPVDRPSRPATLMELMQHG
jgi:hypothetical protein